MAMRQNMFPVVDAEGIYSASYDCLHYISLFVNYMSTQNLIGFNSPRVCNDLLERELELSKRLSCVNRLTRGPSDAGLVVCTG